MFNFYSLAGKCRKAIGKDHTSSLPYTTRLGQRRIVPRGMWLLRRSFDHQLSGYHHPVHYVYKAVRHSTAHMVPGQQDGSFQPCSSLPPECPDSQEKSWVEMPPESPAHGHRASSVVRSSSRSVVPPSSGQSHFPKA